LQFRYRLEGFDPAWSAWQPENVREYTNLPPGPYRFTVISNFNDQEASFSFVIQPKWFQTSWAKALFIGMLGLVIFLVNRWLQFRLQRQKDVLEREQERQLQDERIRNRNQQLQLDIINKSKQLANSTFSLVRKNEILFQLKDELEQIKQDLGARFPEKYYYRMLDQINRQLSDNQDWEIFETNFNLVHDEFFKKLRKEFPDLTPSELRLAAYLRMNLATKEIAPLLNISIRGVENKRYRLRKKLGLDQDANLTDFLLNY
nr:triple tyrosine motif-containing protein [Flavilitoribacter sp.]